MAINSLGDLTPSAMLRKMRRLRPVSDHSSGLFRFGFLRVLPSDVANILVVLETESLDSLAKKADRIMDQKSTAPGSVAAISPPLPDLFTRGEVDEVRQLLRESRQGHGRGRQVPSRPPSSSGPPAPFICSFHSKWGPKAFSCRNGCLFAELPLAKRQGNGPAGR